MPAPWRLSGFGDEIHPDPAVQLAVLAALGARHVEVRAAWGVPVLELEAAQLSRLADLLDDAGMAVSAIASPIGKVDIASDPDHELRRLDSALAAADALGTRYIRIFSFYRSPGRSAADVRDEVLRRLAQLARRARAAEVVLLHENETGVFGDHPDRVLDVIETVGSDALRVAWDPANFVQCGVERPFDAGFTRLRPYLEYLQIKDARYGSGEVVPAGEGDGQVPETLAALVADGWSGFVSLEPHLVPNDEHVRGAREFGRAARALARVAADAGAVWG